jgi:hypothetical protein
MKKLITLLFLCVMTITSYSQKAKTLEVFGNPASFEVQTTQVECGTSKYQSLILINHTNQTITISFDVESYWSNEPNTPTKGDEVYKYTLKPNETLKGDCNNKELLQWSSGPITKTTLVNIKITNIKFSQ